MDKHNLFGNVPNLPPSPYPHQSLELMANDYELKYSDLEAGRNKKETVAIKIGEKRRFLARH